MDDDRDELGLRGSTPAALRDTRWLAGLVWGAALLGLIVTSGAAVTAGAFGAAGLYVPYIGLESGSSGSGSDLQLVASFALVITVAIAGVVAYAWWRFGMATRQLLAGLSEASDDPESDPAPAYWLASVDGGRSEMVELIPALGMAWALIIIRPVAVIALQIYSTF